MSGSAGGWRLDHYGTWRWDEYAPAPAPTADARPALALLPSPVTAPPALEETPIFHAVSDDQSRRAGMRHIEGEPSWAAIPEPNPGSGPLPIQHADSPASPAPGGRRLAAVPTVPAPPGPRDDAMESPEDELRRRAERRRRPRAVEPVESAGPSGSGGRHALQREEPRSGRHALGG